MSRKRARSSSPFLLPDTFRSDSIEDRSSVFVAIYSPTLSPKALQALPEFKSASHRISAWRKPSSQRSLSSETLFEMGHDDDGEKYGGTALEKVLISMDVQGAVVVARWYGGVMLGSVRFDHMKICASEAVKMWLDENERRVKKMKAETDEKERKRLLSVLGERDQSITVLRGLLTEKMRPGSSQDSGKSSAAKAPDYAAMPLATLEKLEQVRDKTIGWVLDQIEKAEEAELEKDSFAIADSLEMDGASTLVDPSKTKTSGDEKTDPQAPLQKSD